MKEWDFYDDEFEDLIRQKTDQYKMYPSDKVWKNVYSSLHTRRRRFIVGMSFLITGILFFAGKELLMTGNHITPVKKIADNISSPINADTITSVSAILSQLKTPATPKRLLSATENKLSINENEPQVALMQQIAVIQIAPVNTEQNNSINELPPVRPGTITENTNSIINNLPVEENNNDLSKSGIHNSTEPVTEEVKKISVQNIAAKENNSEDKNNDNWLQQKASYELKSTVKRGKWNWQVYASPTVNYRSLSGGDPYSVPKTGVQYVPIALTHYGSPEDYVNQKPSMGFEAGGSMQYRLTRNFTFKAGLQFNYTRYSIKAYTSPNSQQANISLNSFYGYNSNTITSYSNIQNFGGNSQKNLYNIYYQLSVPVGFELRILGNEKLQFNIAANIQPTYLINRNSYLLTTDYSDYTKAPSLYRRWNFNGGVEAFISYKIGAFRWQIGPQLRYQLLSTYTDQYPIKENLKQYGIKIGVSKTIW
jgi:outer membrane protein with beta-barrel domain